jgi:hypothetical protein
LLDGFVIFGFAALFPELSPLFAHLLELFAEWCGILFVLGSEFSDLDADGVLLLVGQFVGVAIIPNVSIDHAVEKPLAIFFADRASKTIAAITATSTIATIATIAVTPSTAA